MRYQRETKHTLCGGLVIEPDDVRAVPNLRWAIEHAVRHEEEIARKLVERRRATAGKMKEAEREASPEERAARKAKTMKAEFALRMAERHLEDVRATLRDMEKHLSSLKPYNLK